MTRRKAQSAVEWAMATRSKVRECESCLWAGENKQGPSCLRFVDDVIAVRKERKSDATLEALTEKINDDFDYPYTSSGLRRHIRKCRGYNWKRVFLAR